MATTPSLLDDAELGPGAGEATRSRDADLTRRRLLRAARHRFAHDGYSGTTVRDIAADAGANVALINRYFASKEGLFEACLRRVVEDLEHPTDEPPSIDTVVETVIGQLVGVPSEDKPLHLLLLLRSSGDERADRIRRDTLRSFAERMAAAAVGGHPGGTGDVDGGGAQTDAADPRVLRAEIALSVAVGMVLLRSTTGLEPLASASAAELREPLREVLTTLLSVPSP